MDYYYSKIAHPVDWRYGSEELRKILSLDNLIKLYAKIEAIVAETQAELGVIPKKAAEEIIEASKKITVEEVLEEEKKTRHDLVALINVISSKMNEGATYIHYGLTSQDVKDTALAIILKESLAVLEKKIFKLASLLMKLAAKYVETPSVGRTHGVHANIYSFGHKFAIFADEFLRHIERIEEGKKRFLAGKLSGAVGIHSVLGGKGIEVEKRVMEKLGLYPSIFSSQVVPRDRYAEFFLLMGLVSSSLDRLATEIRNLHRTEIGEAMEAFFQKQVGSSAMPHKRNPVDSESVSGLSRILRSLVITALENVVLWHERDLSNSSAERVLLADSILLLDEQLKKMTNVIENLHIDEKNIEKNLWLTEGLIFSEHVMYKLIEKGMSRVQAHSLVKEISMKALSDKKPFKDVLLEDEKIKQLLSREEVEDLFNPERYIRVAKKMLEKLENKFKELEAKYGLKTL
ncbi:MAG: adenylosuccinate lyase [Candidatus Njordarchaeia archaeon]